MRCEARLSHDHRGLVREGFDEIALADIGRIDLHFARRDLHKPFDHEGRLRAPRASIGINRHGVGVDRINLTVDRWNIVLAREQRGIEIGRHRRRERRHAAAPAEDKRD